MTRLTIIVSGLIFMSLGHAVVAQTYPAKPVRILVGFAPGGGTDIMARALGAKMTESVKQQFIIENRPGANANLAAKLAAEAPADGYTILFMSVAHIMSKPVYKNLGYDIERDFTPITVVSEVSNVFAAHPSLPAKTVKELIALAQVEARRADLRHLGRRQSRALRRRDVQDDDEDQPAAGPLQRRRPDRHRSHGRPRHHQLQHHAADHSPYPGRAREGAGRDQGQARGGPARRADYRRDRAGLCDEHLVRGCCAGEDAARDRREA